METPFTRTTKKITLLTVEDNPLANHCYRLLVKDYPSLSLYSATSGDEALNVVQTKAVDLIFLDRGLPDRDGLVLAKQLRQKGVHCPILMVTATRLPPLLQSQYIGIIQRFYVKPLNPLQFHAIVLRYLSDPVRPF